MIKNKDFREWMMKEEKMKKTSSDQFSTYINAIEEKYGNINEYLDRLIEDAIKRDITEKKFKDKSSDQVANYKSGLRKYWKYIKATKQQF